MALPPPPGPPHVASLPLSTPLRPLTENCCGDLRVVDRVPASIASSPRLGSDGSMMKRRDDSQRSDRLAVTFVDLRVVDRVAASVASWPRLGFDGSMMTRHDDSQRSRPLAVTFGDLRVVDRVAASVASWPRLGFDGSMMTRHDDSQRSRPLAVTATSPPPVAATLAGGRKGRSPRLTWSGEPVTIGSSGIERMPMKRHDDSQRSGRLAVTQPVHPRPPPLFPNRQTTNRSG